ncbi:hypothetical protein DP199_23145, partial [Enterobacter kobei]
IKITADAAHIGLAPSMPKNACTGKSFRVIDRRIIIKHIDANTYFPLPGALISIPFILVFMN